MTLTQKIHDDLIAAMKSGDENKRDVLRLVTSVIKKKQIELKDREGELTDDAVITLISGQIKQRRDSIEQFKKANRNDLIEKEQSELEILEAYLPEQMNESQVEEVVRQTIESLGASSPSDMGKVMGVVMGKLKGLSDGNVVRSTVERLLKS